MRLIRLRVSVFFQMRLCGIRGLRIWCIRLIIIVLMLLRSLQLFGWQRKQDLLLSVMLEILETQKSWTERMLELEMERLRLERLRLEGASPLEVPSGKLRVDEDEQDLEWALDQNLISPAEYASLLEKTGLDSSDIEFM